MVCVPLGNVKVVACDSQYAVFCQPQPLRLLAVLSVARFTTRPDVVLIGNTCEPFAVALENCTYTESFDFEFDAACRRSHSRYGVPATGVNVTSMKSVGEASAFVVLATPKSGVINLMPFGDDGSLACVQDPCSADAGIAFAW